MSEKKSEKKSGRRVGVRLPKDVSDILDQIKEATGFTDTDVVIEALRRAGREIEDDFIERRESAIKKRREALKTAPEAPQKQTWGQTLVAVLPPRAKSPQKNG